MRRLNVRLAQIEECISTSLFAVDSLPREHPLHRGEELLLQLTKDDAVKTGKLGSRVEFALIFDHVGDDPTGAISRKHWPQANKAWRHILYCSETIAIVPMSLEKLSLSQDYAGQTNLAYIEPRDETIIRPYLMGRARPELLPANGDVHSLLATIRNYDRVVRGAPVRTTRVTEHERRLNDPWLGDALKILYDHRCQICTHDFKPRYGVPFADTRFLKPIPDGGEPVSSNLVVLCPNHNAIIGAASAGFDSRILAFQFPNGVIEKLMLRDHLLVVNAGNS